MTIPPPPLDNFTADPERSAVKLSSVDRSAARKRLRTPDLKRWTSSSRGGPTPPALARVDAVWQLISQKIKKLVAWNVDTIFIQVFNLFYKKLGSMSLIILISCAFRQRRNFCNFQIWYKIYRRSLLMGRQWNENIEGIKYGQSCILATAINDVQLEPAWGKTTHTYTEKLCMYTDVHRQTVYIHKLYTPRCTHNGRPTFRQIHIRPTCFRPTCFPPTLFSSSPGFVQSSFVHDLYSSNLFSSNFSPLPFFVKKNKS